MYKCTYTLTTAADITTTRIKAAIGSYISATAGIGIALAAVSTVVVRIVICKIVVTVLLFIINGKQFENIVLFLVAHNRYSLSL